MKSQNYDKYNTKGVSLKEVISELKRELKMRELVYPKQIREGKLHKVRANKQYLSLLKALQVIEDADGGGAPEVEIRQGKLF